jgi:Ca2+-binding RTX toxin-like protein
VNAGDGNDLVFGGPGDDTLNGELGNDRIFAQRGVDTVNGGPGNDDLWALARKDVTYLPGEPADTLDGGPGNDRFHVRDGEADHVSCGPGYDLVRADYRDAVSNDCELVMRGRAGARKHTEED